MKMKKSNIFGIFIIMLCLLMTSMTSVLAVQTNGLYYESDSMNTFNSDLQTFFNTSDFGTLPSFTDQNQEYPTVCDTIGNSDMQLYSYVGNVLRVYTMDDAGALNLLDSYSFTLGYDILDISCVSATDDTDSLIVIYNDTTNIQIDYFDVQNDVITFLGNSATFSQHTPETAVHCSETAIPVGSPPYSDYSISSFCAYGGTNNKIYTFSNNPLITATEITISDLDIYNNDNGFNNIGDKPLNVITSYGSTYEIIVSDIDLTESTSETLFASSNWSNILFLDFDDCSSDTCTLTSSSILKWTPDSVKPTTTSTFQKGQRALNNVFAYPIESSAFSTNGKVFYDEYGFGFTYKENIKTPNTVETKFSETFYIVKNGVTLAEQIIYSTEYSSFGLGSDIVINDYSMITSDMDEDGVLDYCIDGRYTGDGTYNYRYYMSCLELDGLGGMDINVIKHDTTSNTAFDRVKLVGSMVDERDGLHKLIIFNDYENKYELWSDDGTHEHLIDTLTTESIIYFSDMNNDNLPEWIFMDISSPVVYSEIIQEVDDVSVDGNLSYYGLYGFYNPAETNITQNIKATECDGTTTECTYTNENEDPFVKEKLCTTCGDTVAEVCGSWSYKNPQVSCTFNSSGTYNVSVMLYTNTNEDVTAQTLYINDWVVSDDTQNENDLVLIQSPTIVSETESSSDDIDSETSVDGLSGILGAIQNNIKSIVALLIIVGILASASAHGVRNPIVLIFLGIILTVMTVIIGLLDATVLIYILIASIIMIVLNLTVFKSRSGD